MPKGSQGQKRTADMIGNAVHIAKIATGEEQDTTLKQPAKRKSGLAGADDDLSDKIKNYHGLAVDYFSNKLGVAGYIHSQIGMRRVL